MKPSPAANDNLIEQARRFWQPRLGRNLSLDNAEQIAKNATGFFGILAEWSRAEMPVPSNDNGASPEGSDGKEGGPIAGSDQGGRGHD